MKKVNFQLISLILFFFSLACRNDYQIFDCYIENDVQSKIRYDYISHKAYMGGSLLFSPEYPECSQLLNNLFIPIRFGKINRIDNNEVYEDIENECKYACIKVQEISLNSISFEYYELNENNKIIYIDNYKLEKDNSIDLNNDGFFDITYIEPVQARKEMGEIRWLSFLSSKESLFTTMFCVLEEQYTRGEIPNSLFGININGEYIFKKSENNQLSVRGIRSNDYVVDVSEGEYLKYIGKSNKKCRNISDNELSPVDNSLTYNPYFSTYEFDSIEAINILCNLLIDKLELRTTKESYLNCGIEFLNNILKDDLLFEKLGEDIEEEKKKSLTEDEKILLNRLIIEKLFPENTPHVNIYNSNITAVLPLLALNLSEEDIDDVSRARSITNANSFSEYEKKRKSIESIFSEYTPICTFNYSLEQLKNELMKKMGTNNQTNVDNNISDDKVYKLSELIEQNPIITKNQVTEVLDGLRFSIGVMGHFKITFSNIQCGLYAGIFVKAETRISFSKNIYQAEKSGNFCKLEASIVPIDVNLNLFQIPVASIGPVTIKFSLNGGLRLPFKVSASGSIITSYFLGMTAFYAIGFDFCANYGIDFKEVPFLWFTIKVPCGFYFNPYTKGEAIAETVCYAGPIDDIKISSLIELESARLEVTVEPYIYVEPRITICECLFVGIEVGPSLELGVGLKYVSNINKPANQKYSKSIDLYLIGGLGLDTSMTYGIDIDLKIFHPSLKGKVPIKTPLSRTRNEITLLQIPIEL